MSMALLILQWIGRILLVLLVAVLAVLLLVLFVPILYEGRLRVEDPQPHDDAEWSTLQDKAAGWAVVSWLGSFVRGRIQWPEEPLLDLRIAWIHLDLQEMLSHKDKGEGDGEEDKAPDSVSLCDKIKRILRKADYYYRVLHKEETGYTLSKLRRIILRTLRSILPRQWQVDAAIGLDDPAATARVLEVQGMLYPLIAGHVRIDPVFQSWQTDIDGYAKGRIRLIHLVAAALQIALDRRIRLTWRRVGNADQNIERHYARQTRKAEAARNAST